MNLTDCTSNLGRFQDDFAQALVDPDARFSPDGAVAPLLAQPGFAVYRNTVLKGCIDALAANFPAVLRLVGDEWFRAVAAVYARANLPRRPMLLDYGASFPQFLAEFEPAAQLPYLAGVAQLDRLWSEAHFARDDEALDAADLAQLTPAQLARLVLRPHAAARWVWFPTMPIRTIWQRNRGGMQEDMPDDIDWHGEAALIVRPHGAVETVTIGAAGCAFMDACARGCTLPAAAQAAAEVEGSVDLAELTATLFSCGAFAQPRLPEPADDEEDS